MPLVAPRLANPAGNDYYRDANDPTELLSLSLEGLRPSFLFHSDELFSSPLVILDKVAPMLTFFLEEVESQHQEGSIKIY
jgi:hypothetical protein